MMYDGTMKNIAPEESERLSALIEAEGRAFELLDAIEAAHFIRPGRTERAIEQDIRELANMDFGVTRHWHKRVVRAGINTLAIASDNPPDRIVGDDDIVFLDLGPVFEEWEADVGRSYAVGPDPRKHALCEDLPIIFDIVREKFRNSPDITGAELYAFSCETAERHGWYFGGKIAGHIVGEFPHVHIRGDKDHHRINPNNALPLRDPDADGRQRYWIQEVHLVSQDRSFGGFYERLML
jgi:Xaa-Pro dipeptidase